MADAVSPASAAGGDQDRAGKLAAQLKKLTEANAKYKNLLKLAKERIQQQEEELGRARDEKGLLEERISEATRANEAAAKEITLEAPDGSDDVATSVVRVCQRVRCEPLVANSTSGGGGQEEIWALFEMEVVPLSDVEIASSTPRRFREWRRFETESGLQDFIRRDTGEPLTLPQYSLSPEQSATIQRESSAEVSRITEEFRRFRVKAELSRSQAESQIRELQSSKFRSAAQRIEVNPHHQSEHVRSLSAQLERANAELSSQARWKEAYESLVAENQALKSSGSEALLASQWRHRYEACLQEKKLLEERLSSQTSNGGKNGGNDYEAKYRDLKESFRLYRKKAKEIFEAQERGAVPPLGEMDAWNIAEASSAEAKLSYLKNLMVNYLSADLAVRDHMESAIGTVLQFSPDEMDRIRARKKAAHDASWF
jgi:hypothetical protein